MSQLSSAKVVSTEAAIALPEAIQRYFDTINAKDFEQTAALFAEAGQLFPPFDKPIHGQEAIAQYLTKEASDMTFSPSHCAPEYAPEYAPEGASEGALANSESAKAFLVKGKVKNSLFAVNVSWLFSLSASDEIEFVKVKLLAKLNELLKLNQA